MAAAVAFVAIVLLTHCPFHRLVGLSAETHWQTFMARISPHQRAASVGIAMVVVCSADTSTSIQNPLGPTPKHSSPTNIAARLFSDVLYAPRSPPAIDNNRNSLDVKLAAEPHRYRKTSGVSKERPDCQTSHPWASLCTPRLEIRLMREGTDVEASESHNRMLAESQTSVCSGVFHRHASTRGILRLEQWAS